MSTPSAEPSPALQVEPGPIIKGCAAIAMILVALVPIALVVLVVRFFTGDDDEPTRAADSRPAVTQSASASPLPSSSPARPTETPTATPTPPPPVVTPAPAPPPPSPVETDPAVLCQSRPPATGEIFVRYITTDEPPTATRLGGNWVWDFGEEECITSTEFALRTNPPLTGFCTQVALVSDNPTYDENARPAPQLRQVVGVRGDC